jgi:hypothetical protein
MDGSRECDDYKGMRLTIHRSEDTVAQTPQLYGTLNFGLIKGWLRFETKDVLRATISSFVKAGQTRKRDNERADHRRQRVPDFRGPQYQSYTSDEEDSKDEEGPK